MAAVRRSAQDGPANAGPVFVEIDVRNCVGERLGPNAPDIVSQDPDFESGSKLDEDPAAGVENPAGRYRAMELLAAGITGPIPSSRTIRPQATRRFFAKLCEKLEGLPFPGSPLDSSRLDLTSL